MTLADDLARRGLLKDIPVNPDAIAVLVGDSRRHLATAAAAIASGDLAGAYQLAYDAARKALTAALAARGQRVRGLGAHANLIALARDGYLGLGDADVLDQLDRIRQVRNDAEYDGYRFTRTEVDDDVEHAAAVVALTEIALARFLT
jgi:hypothetical protein